jgi:hypothetical protein
VHAKGVLIDISALEMVDSFIGRMLGDSRRCRRVLDAETRRRRHAYRRRISRSSSWGCLEGRAIRAQRGAGMDCCARASGEDARMLDAVTSRSDTDVGGVVARAAGGAAARRRARIHLVDQTKIVTAASELARNTLQYGGGGTLRIEETSSKGAVADFVSRVRGRWAGVLRNLETRQ